MVQKQRDRQTDSKMEKLTDSVSDTVGTNGGRGGTMSRLYNAVTEEGDKKEGAVAGISTAFAGLMLAGIIPTSIIPMLVGFTIGGGVLGKVMPNNVHSVLGGVAVSSFLTFLLAVNIPIFGLGLISTVLFSIVATGATVGAYEYSN